MNTPIHRLSEAYVATEKYDHCQLLSINLCGSFLFNVESPPNSSMCLPSCIKKSPPQVLESAEPKEESLHEPTLPPKSVTFKDTPQVREYHLQYNEKFFKVHGFQLNKHCPCPFYHCVIENLKKWFFY